MIGSGSIDQIALCENPLDVPAAIAHVGDGAAGAIATFLGTTRDQTTPDGKRLIALDYQAYPEMAIRQLADFATQARAKWPIVRLALLHRTGRVDVGQPSVLIAVSTPHRAQAFDACRFLIDTLKAEATIWKKEIWSDASSSWVDPAPPVG